MQRTATPADAEAQRRRELAAIHAAAAKLGLDTADKNPASEYRSLLHALTGKTSTAEMSQPQRKRVLARLLSSGAGQTKAPPPDGWMAEKTRRLWAQLGELQAVREPTVQGLRAFIKAQHGVNHERFLTGRTGSLVIEALKGMLARAQAKAKP